MSARDFVFEALAAFLDFGRIKTSNVESSTKNVTVEVEGNTDDDGAEVRSGQPLWGSAAILFRPVAPTDAGACEVIFVRRGEEAIPLATHDIRWQVDLAEGDVVIRSMGADSRPKVWLKADGTAIIEANEVKIGDANASNTIGLGDVIKSHLDGLKSWLDAHTHAYMDTLPSTSVANLLTSPPTTSPTGTPPDTSPSVPDVESRHKVEN